MAVLLAVLCASAQLVACGSDDGGEADEAALEQARQEGAQAARQNQRIQDLQEQVNRVKKKAEGQQAGATVPSAAPATAAAPAPGSYVPTYVSYSPADPNYAYVAQIPSGGGWTAPSESNPTGGDILRTSLRGPDGTLLIIDRTPTEVPALGGSYDFASSDVPTNFGTATAYTISRSESLPDCNGRPCVDIFINDGAGGGWAVLAGGPNIAVAETIARTVAQSISYGE